MAPFLSERGAVAALLIDAATADSVLDALKAASQPLREKLAAAGASATGGRSGGSSATQTPAPTATPAPMPTTTRSGGSAPTARSSYWLARLTSQRASQATSCLQRARA